MALWNIDQEIACSCEVTYITLETTGVIRAENDVAKLEEPLLL